MADNTSDRGNPDRSFIAGGQDYEVEHFARRHGITTDQARKLIAQHGNSREALDAAAVKLKG